MAISDIVLTGCRQFLAASGQSNATGTCPHRFFAGGPRAFQSIQSLPPVAALLMKLLKRLTTSKRRPSSSMRHHLHGLYFLRHRQAVLFIAYPLLLHCPLNWGALLTQNALVPSRISSVAQPSPTASPQETTSPAIFTRRARSLPW